MKLGRKISLLTNKKKKKKRKKENKKEEWVARVNKSKAILLTCESLYFILMREYEL